MRRPTGGRNAFGDYARTGRTTNPLEANYRDIPVGGFMRLRFLDLTEEGAIVIPGRRAKITNPQNGQLMGIIVHEVPDPDDDESLHPDFCELEDHEGTKLSDCAPANTYRTPVFVYEKVDDKGKIMEEINEIRYLEFTQGLRDSMDALETMQQGKYAFNEETGRPDYDVHLAIVPGEGSIPKNYKFEPVDWNPRTRSSHPNFGKEAEEVLADFEEEIDSMYDEVMEEATKSMTIEEVKNKIKVRSPKKDGNNVSKRPDYRAGNNDEDVDEEPEEEATPSRGRGKGAAAPAADGRERRRYRPER